MDALKEDNKFVLDRADGGLDDEALSKKNKDVVERTIKKYELMRARKKKRFSDSLGERIEALSFYMTSDKNIKPANRYFGRRMMAYLRGESVLDEVYQRKIKMDTDTLLTNMHGQK